MLSFLRHFNIGRAENSLPSDSGQDFADLTSLKLDVVPERKRICIATADIAGPTRNGGIGSAYSELANFLAAMGHDVTVLYLRGTQVEDITFEHWVEQYARRNIKLVPLFDAASYLGIDFGGNGTVETSFNLCLHLARTKYDFVHVSEWRGAAYLSLLCRRQHAVLRSQIFVIKASSPRLWSLESVGQKPDEKDRVIMEAEKRSIELADIVISGSAHLLRWMRDHKYHLPLGRSFVQPNVMMGAQRKSDHVEGNRIPFGEIVFFGRLEGRKGLAIFCDAIEQMSELGLTVPPVTFLGKEGMAMRPGKPTLQWLEERTSGWKTKPKILPTYDRNQALQYLLINNCLAVMPSIMENSSIAVYELLGARVPFITSNIGGSPELISYPHQRCVLFPPTAAGLVERLVDVTKHGAMIVKPSFDNDTNLEAWRSFHNTTDGAFRDWLISHQNRPSQAKLSKPWMKAKTHIETALKSPLFGKQN